MLGRIGMALAAGTVLVAAVACDDNQNKNRGGNAQPQGQEPQSQFGTQASPEEQNLRSQKLEIRDNGVEPRQLQIMAAEPVQLEVVNSSARDCTLYIGSFVQGVPVPAGQTTKQSLTIPQETPSRQAMEWGCAGDETRRGAAIVEFRGVRPESGR